MTTKTLYRSLYDRGTLIQYDLFSWKKVHSNNFLAQNTSKIKVRIEIGTFQGCHFQWNWKTVRLKCEKCFWKIFKIEIILRNAIKVPQNVGYFEIIIINIINCNKFIIKFRLNIFKFNSKSFRIDLFLFHNTCLV